jgi:acyl-CoA-binding protein
MPSSDADDPARPPTAPETPAVVPAAAEPVASPSDGLARENFKSAMLFFKSNADACGKLDYEVNTRLMALQKQAVRGKFIPENEPGLGWFDFVGTDRRNAWMTLEDMPKEEAMSTFCSDLSEHVPEFAPWLAARLEEKARKEKLERERLERERIERERKERERKERLRQQELERERLERERQLAIQQQQQQLHMQKMQRAAEPVTVAAATPGPQWATPSRQPVDGEKAVAPTPGGTNVEVDIKQFREMMQEDPKNCIAVSRAEVIRVKVPNPQPGKSVLRWQFCTEFYDIGFGLDFEPATPEGQEPELKTLLAVNRIMADEAVSIGNHIEPNPGNWVLSFDNSYSYMRAKTVYFTVTNRS